MESLLVDRIVHYEWRMRRALVLEAALLEEGPSCPGRLGYSDGNALAILLRYEMALANAANRTLQQLLLLLIGARRRMAAQSSIGKSHRSRRPVDKSPRRCGIAEPRCIKAIS